MHYHKHKMREKKEKKEEEVLHIGHVFQMCSQMK